jgi:hypothetical protein
MKTWENTKEVKKMKIVINFKKTVHGILINLEE